MKPTVYISIKSRLDKNPVQVGIIDVVRAFGAEPVKQLIQQEVEADIAVTNSVTTAFRWANKTDYTSIILVYNEDNGETIEAFTDCFSDRILVVPLVARSAFDEKQIVPVLAKIIAEKKERDRVCV